MGENHKCTCKNAFIYTNRFLLQKKTLQKFRKKGKRIFYGFLNKNGSNEWKRRKEEYNILTC